jgi:hypothetical protein
MLHLLYQTVLFAPRRPCCGCRNKIMAADPAWRKLIFCGPRLKIPSLRAVKLFQYREKKHGAYHLRSQPSSIPDADVDVVEASVLIFHRREERRVISPTVVDSLLALASLMILATASLFFLAEGRALSTAVTTLRKKLRPVSVGTAKQPPVMQEVKSIQSGSSLAINDGKFPGKNALALVPFPCARACQRLKPVKLGPIVATTEQE